jgi:head-to-tail connecting protein
MEGIQPRNELELTQRDLERLQTLGPFVNLWITECASPALMRVLSIAGRRGLLKPKPASLRGMPLGLSFVSMMKLAQRAAETATMERTAAFAGTLSEAAQAAGVANPLRILNLDEMLREYGDHVSVPDTIFYTQDEVAQHDQARAQQEAQQQAMQATLPAVQAAQGLSKTDIGGGQNALAAMLGNAGGASSGAPPA